MDRRSPIAIALVVATVLVAVAIAFAVVTSLAGEDEDEDASEASGHRGMVMTPSGGEGGGMVVWQDVTDPEVRAELAEQLVAARAAAGPFATAQDAADAGYEQVEATAPGTGVRWERADLVDGTFDPSEPEGLIFDGEGPDAPLAGLAYVATGSEAPDGFAGPNDQWHQDGDDRRMLHTWVVPGWENPTGPFAYLHPDLG